MFWTDRCGKKDTRSESGLARKKLGPHHAGRVQRAARRVSTHDRQAEVPPKNDLENSIFGGEDHCRHQHATVIGALAESENVDTRRWSAAAWDWSYDISSTAEKCVATSVPHGGDSPVPSAIRSSCVDGCSPTDESGARPASGSQRSGTSRASMRPFSDNNNRKPRTGLTRGSDKDYGGLYGSDDDLDTSEWDFDSSVTADTLSCSETGLMPPAMIEPAETKGPSVEDLLEAIEREIASLENAAAKYESASQADLDNVAEGSEDAPDPGVSEGERERNTRLTELLRRLSPLLDCATTVTCKETIITTKGHRHFAHGVSPDAAGKRLLCAHESAIEASEVELVSAPYHSRVIDVLFKIMERPRRAEDASPPRIAEISGLIAANIILSLILSSTFSACIRGAKDRSGDRERWVLRDGKTKAYTLLGNVCRRVFDASRRSGADDVFFISGVATGLLRFVNLATARLEFWSTAEGGGGGLEGTTLTTVCDALTFAVGCLKNVSGTEGLQGRLVRAGAVDTLCKLVRSTRDVCHRCDGSQNSKSRLFSSGDMPQNTPTKTTLQLPHTLANASDTEVALAEKAHGSFGTAASLRNLVTPLLAQSTATLRDLAVGKMNLNNFRTAGAVGTLCSILQPFRNQQDVVLNAARALAKLSLQEDM